MNSSPQGLSEVEVEPRLQIYGPNRLQPHKRHDALALFLAQFKSPITIILLFAALLSLFLDSRTEAIIILAIVLLSSLLSFWQEYSAADAVQKLLAIVQLKAQVRRNGVDREIPVEEIVPGDIVVLSAGDIIPADGVILESKDLFVDEAALTGETFPVEKNYQSDTCRCLPQSKVQLCLHGNACGQWAGPGSDGPYRQADRVR